MFQNSTVAGLPRKCPNSQIFWSVFSHIWNKYGKMRIRKTPNLDNFCAELQWLLESAEIKWNIDLKWVNRKDETWRKINICFICFPFYLAGISKQYLSKFLGNFLNTMYQYLPKYNILFKQTMFSISYLSLHTITSWVNNGILAAINLERKVHIMRDFILE